MQAATDNIPYVRPYLVGSELENVTKVLRSDYLQGSGKYTKACQEAITGLYPHKPEVLLTASCTQALEMAALLCNVGEGDEVILPSFTFVSSVNPFVLRRATPVFVDVNPGDINISADAIEAACTPKTKVIVVVHYAGFACDMDAIMVIAKKRNLLVVEDAAHSFCASTADGRLLGGVGDFGCFSFHATKNVIMGEGGALVVNNKDYARRAHYIWEKGTNRIDFVEGKVDKYSWVDVGSSFLPPESSAAILLEQLKHGENICANRVDTWNRFHAGLSEGAAAGLYRLAPAKDADGRKHPGHIFWIIFPSLEVRKKVETEAKTRKVAISGHYVPLHSSPFGKTISRAVPDVLKETEYVFAGLLRLPIWFGMTDLDITRTINAVRAATGQELLVEPGAPAK